MYMKQISVFLENTIGRLTDFTGALEKHQVDIKAMYVAETTDFGILRVLVTDPEKTKEILSESGFNAVITDVLAVEVDNVAGSLHKILEKLTSQNIAVEYIYSALQLKKDKAILVFKVKEGEKAITLLEKAGVKMLVTEALV